MARDDRLRYDPEKREFYYDCDERGCGKKKRCCKSRCKKRCKPKCENICDPPDPDCVDWCETCSECDPIEDPCDDPCEKKCTCKKSCCDPCSKKCKKRKCGRFRSRPKSSSKSRSSGRYRTGSTSSSLDDVSSRDSNRRSEREASSRRDRSERTPVGTSRSGDSGVASDSNEGIIGWIKAPFEDVDQGRNISFNAIQENEGGDIVYDDETDEFIVNSDGMYALKWNINVSPVKNIGDVYITFTFNDEQNEQVLTGVKNVFKGVNGTPNIVNSSYLVFNANEGDRYSLNNSSGDGIKILFLDSSIGGKITIDRIQ